MEGKDFLYYGKTQTGAAGRAYIICAGLVVSVPDMGQLLSLDSRPVIRYFKPPLFALTLYVYDYHLVFTAVFDGIAGEV